MLRIDPFKYERTRQALKELGLECALFTDFYNVSYLTGYRFFFENGPSPFTENRAAALFIPDEVVLIAEGAEETLEADGWTLRGQSFTGYSYVQGNLPLEAFRAAVLAAIEQSGIRRGRIGCERSTLPAAVEEALRTNYPELTWVDLPYMTMRMVRAVKSAAEIAMLTACAQLAEVGQEAVRQAVQKAGNTEIEIYNQAKAAMEAHIGGRFALQSALHAGINTQSPFPGMPTNYVTQLGDLIISDMVPYYQGYWADTCSTYVVGGPEAITDQHRKLLQVVQEAFALGFEAARPGVSAGQIDQIVRDYLAKYGYYYPHHTGHGVGVSNQDEPRIIIGATVPLEVNMVVVIEPPAYVKNWGGLRLERMFRITADGAELLSHNPFDLA